MSRQRRKARKHDTGVKLLDGKQLERKERQGGNRGLEDRELLGMEAACMWEK